MPKEKKSTKKASKAAPAPVVVQKKRRAKKDKDAPKRGMSAYMFFVQDKREGVKTAKPELAFGEISKELGAMWKALSDDEKTPYVEKAAADRERYLKEKATYDSK
mmetsp:Transcript_6080/g.10387  ORF Transcript_6080/g.10387 Transcript_6080/m.10387 type:complete len:105 (-) Transcript_6080:323-637(-)|eukprot:CAMPEP_0197448506 /NCGR_PEP_ID=MMETSP1175-20131217/17736_1 /TAXON_ID=1003142 /ORGANISM="Triceratium dubium, Strain CCMP147" /LENGTH=104 /DNA_ID=CAMNT_0042980281 /DNA_START=145 /DNA_END=459 /DNA_ORIENTATION=+